MYPDKIESFQITKSALLALFPDEAETKFDGNLPSSAFQWEYANVKRNNVINGEIDIPTLQKWVSDCNQLGVAPVLLYSEEHLHILDDAVESLVDDGMMIERVTANNRLYVGRGEDEDEAPIPTRIMQPDEAVICRYIGMQYLLAKNAWDISDDLQFWFTYGKAMTIWKFNTSMERWKRLEIELQEDIASKYSYSNATFSSPDRKTHSMPLDDHSSVTYFSDLPFIHDVRKGALITRYGRLSLFDVALNDKTSMSKQPTTTVNAVSNASPLERLKRLFDFARSSVGIVGAHSDEERGDPIDLIITHDDLSVSTYKSGDTIGDVVFTSGKGIDVLVKNVKIPAGSGQIKAFATIVGCVSNEIFFNLIEDRIQVVDIKFTINIPESCNESKNLSNVEITIGDHELACKLDGAE